MPIYPTVPHHSLRVVLFLLLVVILIGFTKQVLAQSGSADINVAVITPVPQFSLTSPSGSSLEVRWNWDSISLGYYPPAISEMQVEISTDAFLYTNLQAHPASDFLATYLNLPAGTYTARITILDGNDYDYVVGPIVLSGGGSGAGGGPLALPPPAPPAATTDLTINGLAYPGPSSVVIFTYNTVFQANIVPAGSGTFTHQTTTLPAGAGTLAFSAQDPDNVLSVPVTVPYTLIAGTPAAISVINLPPTITLDQSVVTVGEIVIVKGYGYQSGNISLSVDGPTSRAYLVQASSTGAWQVSIDTADIGPGTYDVIATSTSQDLSIVSPDSDQLVLQVTPTLPAAPICNDGTREDPEQCDDGNVVNGDGCSDTCQLETDLPQSSIDQPVPSVQSSNDIDLIFTATSPNDTISSVKVFYSRNGAPYEQYPGVFSTSPAALVDLPDGDYEVYSIATDTAGAVESAPPVADATFVIDAVIELSVLAYPEKRSPRQGNWGIESATLDLYDPNTKNALYHYDLATDQKGRGDIPAGNLPERNYVFLLKGASQLSKRLESPAFRGVDLLLDFTFGGSFFLLSGDVKPDDYINGLDLSATVIRLYSAVLSADLNRDGLVNGMDLSIIITNLYKAGDGV
jgi:cysteine-rich repeat protein